MNAELYNIKLFLTRFDKNKVFYIMELSFE